jgi:hypothetical protein
MKVGFSLSSGGLLLPYHLGVLDSLQYHNYLTPDTPIAGASAGAIAVATKACDIDSKLILDDTIGISEICETMGRARGNLLPLLREKLEHRVDEDRFQTLLNRPGDAVVSYYEIFPSFGPIHETEFGQKEDFIDAVCHSSTFPFFASNWPVALGYRNNGSPPAIKLGNKELQIPRLVADGYFAVPGDRFGCPDFEMAGVDVNRTILVTPFPRDAILLKKSIPVEDTICPEMVDNGIKQSADLLRLATQPSPAEKHIQLYEAGYADAERWCQKEASRSKEGLLSKLGIARRSQ